MRLGVSTCGTQATQDSVACSVYSVIGSHRSGVRAHQGKMMYTGLGKRVHKQATGYEYMTMGTCK